MSPRGAAVADARRQGTHPAGRVVRTGRSDRRRGGLAGSAGRVRAMRTARHFSVEQMYVFATSAVRDAINREEIVARIDREAGFRPEFLSGG